MYIKRKIEGTISKYLNSKEIIAIVGPRQCGKTTLLQHIYKTLGKDAVFLTFEDKKTLDLFEHHLDEFINLYVRPNKYVFIDEFQYARKGGKGLKYIYDTNSVKIFISESSTIDLTVQAVKYLVGRIFVFSLYPLDFEEFLIYKDKYLFDLLIKYHLDFHTMLCKRLDLSADVNGKIRDYYNEYAVYGGYPRVVLSLTIEEKKIVLKNIYNTYFLREVKDILGLTDDYQLTQLLKALALQIGNLVEYQEVMSVANTTFVKGKSHLNFLQKTFVCDFTKPFFKSRLVEIVKNPKVYFFDTGFRNYIVDDFRNIPDRPDGGALLENTVAMELIKREVVFKFWRTKKQAEIDFVLDLPNGKRLAIDARITPKDFDFSSGSVSRFESLYASIPLLLCGFSEKTVNKTNIIFAWQL